MADFFYWNKASQDDGFNGLSVYLLHPANGLPGWYFANYTSYSVTHIDRNYTRYVKMPVKFGIHHASAKVDEAHKPTKIGKPGDYLTVNRGGAYQIISEEEFSLKFAGKSSRIAGQKIAESSITIQTGATGMFAPAGNKGNTPGPAPGY